MPSSRRKTSRDHRRGNVTDRAIRDSEVPIERDYALALMGCVKRAVMANDTTTSSADERIGLDRLIDELRCPNCLKRHSRTKIYCCDQCEDEAQVVRLVRNAIADGRIENAESQVGIGQKLLQIIQGGYPTERILRPALRRQIFDRDGRVCRICGKPGDQIDHISGSSNDPTNLRVVCGPCNRLRVTHSMVPMSIESADFVGSILDRLAVRIAAPEPLQTSDRPEWTRTWIAVRTGRRAILRAQEEEDDSEFEDVDGRLADAMNKDD